MLLLSPLHKHNRQFSYLLLFAALYGLGCSDKDAGDSIGTGPDPDDQADAGEENPGDDDGIGGGQTNMGGIIDLDPNEICKTITATAEVLPVDVYIMLDQSISMNEPTASGVTRWQAETDAIAAFVGDSRAAGIGVGIDYFGVGPNTEENCNAAHYADPDVGIADLPGNSAAILSSLENALGPQSNSRTPTYAALDGALQHARQHAQEAADEGSGKATVVVLASDGFPTECEQSLPAISQLAADAFNGTPAIRTYFISLTEGEANAKVIAEKGGGRAFAITDQDDVKAKFLDAMLSVTSEPIACSHELNSESLDGGVTELFSGQRASASFTSRGTGQVTRLPLLKNSAECLNATKEGFYLTPADNPTLATLCSKSCDELGAGDLKIDVACKNAGGVN